MDPTQAPSRDAVVLQMLEARLNAGVGDSSTQVRLAFVGSRPMISGDDFRNRVGFYGILEEDVRALLDDELIVLGEPEFDPKNSKLAVNYVKGPSSPDVADAAIGKLVLYGVRNIAGNGPSASPF